MERLEAIVEGKVQGVTYRYFASEEAKRLSLVGFAENLGDGRVKVVAEGERASLDAFVERLKKGPLFAYVEEVETAYASATGEFRSFDIR
jgi:acylphosphatase